MIVAARAGHRQAEEAAGHHVHAIVPLVGAGHFDRAVVVIPGTESEEAGGRQRLVAGLLVQQVAGELRLHELVVGQVVVERLDHPIAIEVGVGIGAVAARIRIQAAVVVFAVAGDVEPDAAPALAVVRRCEQAVDHFGEGVGRGVFFEGRDFFGRGRQAGQVEASAADQVVLAGGLDGLEPFLFEFREHEAVDRGLGPARVLDGGRRRILERQQRPEGPALGGDRVLAVARH